MAFARGGEEVRGLKDAGGIADRAAVAEADPDALVPFTGPCPPVPFTGLCPPLPAPAPAPVVAAPLWTPTWAAEAVIGFPQSMQNREVASFSRPQNEQTVNRHPPRRENHMAREYRRGQIGGQ